MLVSPTKNKVRKQELEAQIAYHSLGVVKRTLQRSLLRHTKKARMYKEAYTNKELKPYHLNQRVAYGKRHLGKTVDEFWKFVRFTDEFHLDPSAAGQERVLREQGTRYREENIQQRPGLLGNKLHIAGWVTYDDKIKNLIFYNERTEKTIQPKPPPKPRKSKYITEDEYAEQIKEWQAKLPPKEDIKPKGNAMTQDYYTKHILPHYIDAMQQDRYRNEGYDYYLVEDGDPSHGLRKSGIAQQMRDANWIVNLQHPTQSPDLNPGEGIWLIEKMRVRQHCWNDLEELKILAQTIWDEIPQWEIRKRIDEMPERCKRLIESGGMPIKSDNW